jgi:uncharacterized membrane protein
MPITIITAAAVVGCLLTAGVYVAFAVMVMPALTPDPRAGTTVMREINRWAVRPPFMALFFGTAILCIVALVLGVLGREPLVGLGAAGYLVGVVITVVGNVPLNDALARAASGGSGGSGGSGPPDGSGGSGGSGGSDGSGSSGGSGSSAGPDDEDAAWAVFVGPWSRLNLARAVVSALGGILLLMHLLA